MNNKTNPLVQALRLSGIFLGLIMLFANAGLESVPVSAASATTPALVRIDLRAPVDLENIAVSELPVMAQLLDSQGHEYLLALANPTQQAELVHQGFSFHVLDPDSREAVYYLLYSPSPDAIDRARTLVAILYDDGRQVVARATPARAEQLPGLGIELRRLYLRPLVLRSQSKAQHLPRAVTPNPVVQDMIARVQSSQVYSYTGDISGEWPVIIGGSPYTITTRYSRADEPIQKATQYVYEHFESLGLAVQFHEYDLDGSGMRRNVVAEQRGSTQPERIYLITAHLDDLSQSSYRFSLAPGADDNASGSTGVLIAADVLSKYNFGCTLRYVLFTGEEQGLLGSENYASDLYNLGESVEGVLNLDMIAYNSDSSPTIELHTRPDDAGDLAIANLFSDTVSAYNINLTPQILPDGMQRSDHASFWDYGYPGILAIEDNVDFTPYYHTISDTLATLNLTYFTNFVKAAVGTLAHMGCLLDTPGNMTGVVYDAGNGDLVNNAFVQASPRPNLSWSAVSGMDGVYNLPVISGTYTVTVSAPGYPLHTTTGIPVTAYLTTTLDLPLCAPVTGAHFIYQPESPEPGYPITFTGGITAGFSPITYTWDFGDNAIASGQVVTHTYTVSDVYTIVMTASNCADDNIVTGKINVGNVPEIGVSPTTLKVSLKSEDILTHTLTISNAWEGTLSWNLAEQPEVTWLDEPVSAGEISRGATQVNIIFNATGLASGAYTTTLRVTSNDLHDPQVDVPVTLTVNCQPISGADFSHSPAILRVGQPVTFTSVLTTGSPPVSYTWDFGDGTAIRSGEGLSVVTHTFPTTTTLQTYQVSLRTSNLCSDPPVVIKSITVKPFLLYLPNLFTSKKQGIRG